MLLWYFGKGKSDFMNRNYICDILEKENHTSCNRNCFCDILEKENHTSCNKNCFCDIL